MIVILVFAFAASVALGQSLNPLGHQDGGTLPIGVQHEREVHSTTKCVATTDGSSVPVRRCIGGGIAEVNYLNPFLVFDALSEKSKTPTEETSYHFPAHPHRGFIEIRYVISGRIDHYDSCENNKTTHAGGAHRFNTGRGIVHEETISFNESLLLFQLWLNMPTTLKKKTPPSITVFQKNDIPIHKFDRKHRTCITRNLTTLFGWGFVDVDLTHMECVFRENIPEKQNAFVYVYKGVVDIHSTDPQRVSSGELSILGEGTTFVARGVGSFLLATAPPVGERVFQQGGFVMGTEEDVKQAVRDLHNGWKTQC